MLFSSLLIPLLAEPALSAVVRSRPLWQRQDGVEIVTSPAPDASAPAQGGLPLPVTPEAGIPAPQETSPPKESATQTPAPDASAPAQGGLPLPVTPEAGIPAPQETSPPKESAPQTPAPEVTPVASPPETTPPPPESTPETPTPISPKTTPETPPPTHAPLTTSIAATEPAQPPVIAKPTGAEAPLAATAAASGAVAAASGLPLEQRCAPNSPLGLQISCWDDLQVEAYIYKWIEANAHDQDCINMGFTQCYLTRNGYGGRTCDLITSETCTQPETQGHYESPQQFYTLWSIWQINRFFNDYSQSLWNGHQLAASTIDDIVATFSMKTTAKKMFGSNDFYQMLNGGFNVAQWQVGPIPPGPFNPTIGLVQWALVGVTKALIFAPLMSRDTMVESTDQRFMKLADIGSKLADLVVGYQKELEKSVQMILGNSTLFLLTASNGSFSSRLPTSIVQKSEDLFRHLQVFVLSEAVKASGIIVAKSNVNVLEKAKQVNNKKTLDCPSLGPNGNCYNFWPDPATKYATTYSFHWEKDWQKDWTPVMNKIYEKKWATFDQIFPVEDCSGKSPSFDAKNLKVNCAATHKVCTWNYTHNPHINEYYQKQWTDCDNDKPWGTVCSWFGGGWNVPKDYLGPYLDKEGMFCRYDN